jgi:hypothetical protein
VSQVTTLELQGQHFISVFPELIASVTNDAGEVTKDNSGLFNTRWNIWGLGEHDLGVAQQSGLQPNDNNVAFMGIEFAYNRDPGGSVDLISGNNAPFINEGSEVNVASNFLNGFDPLTGAPNLYVSGNIRITTEDQHIVIEGLSDNDYFFVDAFHDFDPSLDIEFVGFEHGIVTNTSGLDMRFVDGLVDTLNETNENIAFDVFPEFL